jgi:nucleoside-diphosphate-sugar epimerase
VPQENNKKTIFISGGTGYIGTRLIRILLKRGHPVLALVRKESEYKVPAGAKFIIANPFDAGTFQSFIPKESVFIHLLGVSHPSPKKAKQFQEIDWPGIKASAGAAMAAGVSHFIYISVSMAPTKLMAAFQAVRKDGEAYCLANKLNCTFIRPWYVLGPGHWWPVFILPFYGIAELVPAWRKKARAMGLVTIKQMLAALLLTVESAPVPLRILEIKDIRAANKNRKKN